MKRIIVYVTLIIIFMVLGIIGFMNQPTDLPSTEILNTKYYMFNGLTGEYEELELTENEINYKGSVLGLDNTCKNYEYNKQTKIIKLDCRKAFKISLQNEVLIININDINYNFYTDKERSYKGEFEKKFNSPISTYKLEGEHKLKEKEISIDNIKNIINQNNISFIYLKGSLCKDACTIFNKEFLNLKNKNIYYLDVAKLTDDDINTLAKTYETLPNNLSDYNKAYPQVLIVGNKEIRENKEVILKGFDLTETIEYLNNYEVNNE